MYSLNYHRFILHIYLYAIRLGELNDSPFSEVSKNRISKSIDYLYQLIDPESGQMPGYGSNDGALVLPLNNCDFTDYRPLLQLGSYATKGTRLFQSGAWDEPLYWLYGSPALQSKVEAPPQTSRSYADGGISILRGSQSKAIIRCTVYRARPSHADQLHVDLWIRGQNIACDAGTYLYSGEGIWRNGLAHTAVHNTVTVDQLDQMKMVSRFTWTNWARGKALKHDKHLWQGEHDGYKRRASCHDQAVFYKMKEVIVSYARAVEIQAPRGNNYRRNGGDLFFSLKGGICKPDKGQEAQDDQQDSCTAEKHPG
jgi:asparagine synthase (glutamine-hydrolysing)